MDVRRKQKHAFGRKMELFSEKISRAVGTSTAFLLATLTVIVWAVLGPVFGFSDTWQLVINTLTTLVTFLMVFLIQRSQNKDMEAVELKLNELVAALEGASNRLIAAEDLSEDELHTLRDHYRKLVEMAKQDSNLASSHSIDEATSRHHAKKSSPERKQRKRADAPRARRRHKRLRHAPTRE